MTTQPGREMDAAIARSLGWADAKYYPALHGHDADAWGNVPNPAFAWEKKQIPHYSTHTPDAALLLDEAVNRGWCVSVYSNVTKKEWAALITGPGTPIGCNMAPTFAEAVCRAWLSATQST